MATSPAVTKLESEIATSKTWLQKHQTLVLAVLGIGLCIFVSQKYFDYAVNADTKKEQIALSQLEAQKTANAQALADTKQTLADYKAALDVYAKQNSELTAAISKRTATVVVQQRQDAELPPPALANRWKTLVNKPGIQETATGFSVDSEAGLATVQQLELVPVLTMNLADERTKEANDQQALGKANALIDQGKELVSGLQSELTKQDSACKIQIKTVEDKARKSRLKFLGIGYVLGFLSGVVVHGL